MILMDALILQKYGLNQWIEFVLKKWIWMFPKIGVYTPKLDGLFHGKPY